MTHVLGRDEDAGGPQAALGRYRATDGGTGAPVALDVDRPHAALIVGKRGSGKSYTLGVLAEELAATPGVTALVVDPMGGLDTLAQVESGSVVEPRIPAGALPPRAWCDLLGVDPTSDVGSLLWRAAAGASTVAGMRDRVADAEARAATRRAALNHLDLAASWEVFGDGEPPRADGGLAVLDLSGVARAPANAVLRAAAEGIYERALAGGGPLPWLLVDEAHAFVDGVALTGLSRLLTRGRQPGASVVLATQRPGALPEVAISQADLLLAHRLSGDADRSALSAARPAYLRGRLDERLPDAVGEALVVDDATRTAEVVRIRERDTPHGGESPRASRRA